MRSTDIRRTFLDYFTARGHTPVPSGPLIPDDPGLLLTIAGMGQFKPYYLGESRPPAPRLTTVQKCVRTNDIENVGRTARHATFFEMLGNFSFGDYFKADAVAYAWELLTRHYQLDPDRLWITVFTDDDEAVELWRRTGVRDSRIQRLGRADNYWSMGVPGPSGPSSELCYDRGPAFGAEGGPAVDGERYVELWNLVFMQHLRGEGDGKEDFPILGDLPTRNIDTGLGLDRLAMVLQDVETICQTDLLAPTLALVQELAGRPFPGRDGSPESVSFQVVTEHARTAAFLIADGVLPGNEGRGYVLRRILRRAIRHARTLGIDAPVLGAVTGSVLANLGDAWPELTAQRELVEAVTAHEEETFGGTLRHGGRLLDAAIGRARATGSGRLPGETAFELHDTYGFPIDLTVEAARAAGLDVDRDRYATLLDEQRRRARGGDRGRNATALRRTETYRDLLTRHGRTEFVGYTDQRAETELLAVLRDGRPVDSAGEDDRVELVLRHSPFYAESGGQVGDGGRVRTADGTLVEITDTRYGLTGLHVHEGRVGHGELRPGTRVSAEVDGARRAATERSHSATHVLHAMLRRVLGEHARQQGSLVAPGRLRFDFAHFAPVDETGLDTIGTLVNDYLLDDPEVRVWQASRAEAEAAGATAFFGDRYDEQVRIVDIGDASRELCGGTHVGHGTQAGPVRLLGESSVGAGVRRIEALTGRDALRYADTERRLLAEVGRLVGARPDDLLSTLAKRLGALGEAEAALRRHRQAELDSIVDTLLGQRRAIGSGWLVSALRDDLTPAELRTVAGGVLARGPAGAPTVVLLATSDGGRAQLVAGLDRTLLDRGGQARDLLTEAGRLIGGGAGGTGGLANAGGRRADRIGEALSRAEAAAGDLLTRHPG
ncbi:alanine--tRNA ligase [Plantactinospora endophytica]|uniref:Alanine--tRNA ligase n=1 Tax=Plantactinospora endophytica TaxID=673535 RepID=A0ABQ4ECB2_9ACTN|nr:alanine--tRNA ligase [Plantactinospora endophytica]GIG91906.1 alanine--tRNA ligase [Plantactinospora endophytica]